MSVSLTFLQQQSNKTGYTPTTLEKVVRLGELAEAINNHALLAKSLLLKGGTPLNLAFGRLTRLSVDLDYNYVGAVDRDLMIAKRQEVETEILGITERLSYTVQQSADEFAGRKFYLGYKSAMGSLDRVEIDISYLFRVPFEPPIVRSLWQPGGLDAVDVRVVSDVELVVGKVLAFLDRVAPRDAWDIKHFSESLLNVITSPNGRGWLIAMSAILVHPLVTYTRDRANQLLTPKKVREQLVPMLASEQTVDANTLASDAWQIISPLLEVTSEERTYVKAIQNGEILAKMLFPNDSAAAARVAKHPAIRWKLKNVMKQIGKPLK